MAFKFILFAALVAYARAGAIGYSAPAYENSLAYSAQGAYRGGQIAVAAAPAYQHAPAVVAAVPTAIRTQVSDESYDPHPQYSYSYDVNDQISGDIKNQHEERDADLVRGKYSLLQPDGYFRIVEYTADDHSGFNAIVRTEKATHAVTAVAHAAPIAINAHGLRGHY